MTDNRTTALVSIIMPTYNRAGLILETIKSIRGQTYQNWELVIVDDGSDDNTKEIVDRLQDKRIQFIAGGRTGIVGKIKNKGIAVARGELIAFIDSDDLWAPTKLEKQVAALQQFPEAGFSLSNGYNFRTANEPIDFFYEERNGINYANVFLPFFRSEIAAFTQTMMVRQECLSVTGLFKETGTFSDLDFIAAFSLHYKAVILYEPLVWRRLHEANYITPNWEKSYFDGIAFIRSYTGKLPATVAKNALFRTYINYGEKCLVFKQRKKAAARFLKSWQYKPLSIVPLKKTMKAFYYFLSGK